MTEAHGVNNLPKVVTERCPEQDLNLRPTDRKPKCLTRYTTAPPITVFYDMCTLCFGWMNSGVVKTWRCLACHWPFSSTSINRQLTLPTHCRRETVRGLAGNVHMLFRYKSAKVTLYIQLVSLLEPVSWVTDGPPGQQCWPGRVKSRGQCVKPV